ncbi:hypothetical protein F3I16_18380 [Pseudomonas sp. L-22-4S-12]|uniref:hypothetical protein n=1 Tax=Pseudomonas sp. L-22-4S-12 TaxID=2610893 RepID=UPI00132A3AFF|nr:hypothetical protein [Pseudomonas sp. L-22-4S-12]MWV18011.1 hypothetical protein [Pseudomonas sp. L-22-4S-12]
MHAKNTIKKDKRCLALGLTLIAFSAVFFLATHGSPAPQNELIEVYGKVSEIKESRGKYGGQGFEFWLTPEVNKFRFEAHGVEYDEVLASLKSTRKINIRILAHPKGNLSWFSGLRTFPVYSINVPHGPEISYEQLSQSWMKSNFLARKVSGISAAIGMLFISIFIYFRARPSDSSRSLGTS